VNRTRPDRTKFLTQAASAAMVPLIRELHADWWTPVAVYHLLSGGESHCSLFESVEGGERIGRYSFVGRRPFLIARARGDELTLEHPETGEKVIENGLPLDGLRKLLSRYQTTPEENAPPFISGAVGYFGYDTARWIERLPDTGKPGAREEDMTLLFLSEVAAFDHVRRKLYLVVNARVDQGEKPDQVYEAALARLDAMEAEIHAPIVPPRGGTPVPLPGLESNLTRESFMERVQRAKERITAGDIFQVVLSQRFRLPSQAGDLSLYRSLRSINPSPYMFLLRFDGWSVVGSSPEPLLRVNGDRLTYRPIAGTAPRSSDPDEDRRRAEALLADPKERAEHVMLVDLGRNDLGRCAVSGSVRVDELMTVERYSHVMHLVSGLSARLHPGLTPLDALYSCFPAGTVSGAPKVRAMEIIEELEPDRRGLYAGAVGYLDFSGNLDTCIALRTMIVRDGEVLVQAGAGIVADSDPAREYDETCQKAAALLQAVGVAGEMDAE
jgi:anthranilate synthase component 1